MTAYGEEPSCQQLGLKFFADSPFTKSEQGINKVAYYDREIYKSMHHDWPDIKTGKIITSSDYDKLSLFFRYDVIIEPIVVNKEKPRQFLISPFLLLNYLKRVPFDSTFILEVRNAEDKIVCQEKILYTKAEI